MTRVERVIEQVEANGAITLLVAGRVLGQIFAVVKAEPDGWWYGRRYGTAAQLFTGREKARRYVLGEGR